MDDLRCEGRGPRLLDVGSPRCPAPAERRSTRATLVETGIVGVAAAEVEKLQAEW